MGAISPEAKAKQKASITRLSKTPLYKYSYQKRHAASRGIPFTLTFEEWWKLWEDSGKYSERGKKPHQYCMSRNKDIGGYEVGNVYISQVSDNLIDQMLNGKHVALKVTADDIIKIKERVANGEVQKLMAKDYNLNQSQVSRLISGARGKYSSNIA